LDEGEKIIRNCIDKIARYDNLFQDARKLSSYLAKADNFIILGKGINYSVAMETERMFDIYTNVPARAYESGEFKHGPLTMIKDRGDQFDKRHIVIAIAPHDETYSSIKNTIEQIKTRDGEVIELTNIDDERLIGKIINRIKLKRKNKEDNNLKMPTLDFYENAEIILLQNLVIGAAKSKNIFLLG
ncbi:MAG: SIS domain-containing protein, partial [Candidatus Aenigmarchaeota archaeon]|nr:SIS domain-containing protein [Candidatus Aenigmarchaeota archaeon]